MPRYLNAAGRIASLVPGADVDLPNFDQWLNPAIEAPVSSQKVPAIIDDELDAELTMGDPDPTTPFFMFVHAGYRRLGEVGHYVRKRTKGLARVGARWPHG